MSLCLLAIGSEPLEHTRHLGFIQNDRLPRQPRRPVLVAKVLNFASQPKGLGQAWPKTNLPVVGKQATRAPFHCLKHGIGKFLGAKLRIVGHAQGRAAGNSDHIVERRHFPAQTGECRCIG